MTEQRRKLSTPRTLVQRKTNTIIPAPGSPNTSQEHTTAQRYRDTLNSHQRHQKHSSSVSGAPNDSTVGAINPTISPRNLDDGCQACNMSKVYCDAIWYQFNRPCCGMCGHP